MKTYIFGHKNPDTDSVCSSIALSYLKNELGDNTEPRVLGNINNETKFVLEYFNIEVPSYLNDVRVRIKDVNYDKLAYINEYKSINAAFKKMQRENITAIPLVNKDKVLSGYVTLKELAKYLINGDKEHVNTTIENIIETLDGEIVIKCNDIIEGNILIAGIDSETIKKEVNLTNNDILVVGNRVKVLEYAIESCVKLIILPLNVNVSKEIINKAKKNNVSIIKSSLDTFQIGTKLSLSNYVRNININKSPVTVNNEDCFTDFKTMSHKVNHTNYPIINNKNECLGLIRLTGPNDFEKQKVILVDHNNLAQSVDGIEEADILEIIDHHNLGDIGTSVPINFRSKPVGCTATMIYEMYKEESVDIPRDIAGLMLSAILSDTLLLTSPTTTELDKKVAKNISDIANIEIDKYGLDMLRAASSIEGMSVDELVKSDFKSFTVNGKRLGIGQVMTLDFETIKTNMEEFISYLDNLVKNEFNVVALFVTDIIKKGSYIIYNTDSVEIMKSSFGIEDMYQGYFLDDVVSRKKQILPNILTVMESED